MQGFAIPKEFEDFVTSAPDLLNQYKQHSNSSFQDFVVFRIFDDNGDNKTLKDLIALRQRVMGITSPLMESYVWHNDCFRVKVVIPKDRSPMYLAGVVEFGDCVDDEWFVVSLLYEVSKTLHHVSISATDTDGQFLLIEASSADLPDWIGPENSDNRVWIKCGQLHIIPLDEAGRRRSGGLDVPSALLTLKRCSDSSLNTTTASFSVQQTILSRTTHSLTNNKAQLHKVAVTVPLKVAQLLTARPAMISKAVAGLCTTERTKHTNKIVSSMAYFGTSPLVTISTTFTRALYAQLTFQERFHPPPKFLNAQRVLQSKQERDSAEQNTDQRVVWDASASKSFDVGCRLACGLEICYQQALGDEKQWHLDRISRENEAKSYLASCVTDSEELGTSWACHLVTTVPTADLSSDLILSRGTSAMPAPLSTTTSGVNLLNCFRPSLSTSEVVNLTLRQPKQPLSPRAKATCVTDKKEFLVTPLVDLDNRGEHSPADDGSISSVQDILITEVSYGASDSDDWLYMTPDEFDANMQARIKACLSTNEPLSSRSTRQREDRNDCEDEQDSDDDNSAPDLWKNHPPPSPTKQRVDSVDDDNNVQTLTNIVSGMDSFMASYSDYSGVSKSNADAADDDEDDDEEDDGDDDSHDDEDDDFDNVDDSKIDGEVLLSDEEEDGDDSRDSQPQVNDRSASVPEVNHNNNIDDQLDFDSSKLMEILAAQGMNAIEFLGVMENVGRGDGSLGNENELEGLDVEGLTLGPDHRDGVRVPIEESGEDEDRDSFYDDSDEGEDNDDAGEDDSDDEECDSGLGSGPGPVRGGRAGGAGSGASDEEESAEHVTQDDYMDSYMDCLDAELSASTLVETFEKYNSESNVRPSASLSDVDIEKNLLKNFLESQAGQMGTTGPASNLLSQMGLSLPLPPKMNEEPSAVHKQDGGYHDYHDEDSDGVVDSDDDETLPVSEGADRDRSPEKSRYMNPLSDLGGLTVPTSVSQDVTDNYFLNDSSLD